ncbi:MAG: DUF222 domain-containing protein [Ilumatobacteraceae bacterium]
MDIDAIRRLLTAGSLADLGGCRAELAALRAIRGMVDAREMRVLARMDEIAATPAGSGSFPDADHAAASKAPTSAADRVRRRSKVADTVPELGAALDDGDTTGERLDIVARATSGMSDAERARFAVHGDRLRDAARDLPDREFRALVDRLAAQARTDDGRSRLERQRRATRLRWWHDNDGMWRLDGRFDPESGLTLDARIRKAIDALFHGGSIPEGAPTDPVERQQFLAAHALLRITAGGGAAHSSAHRSSSASPDDDTAPVHRPDHSAAGSAAGPSSGPDITVVIDARTLLDGRHSRTRLELGLGLADSGLPIDTIRRWACLGTITPAIVSVDGQRLLLGRERRLANRHQRRALRIVYPTCALCDTPFEYCDVHHVEPWELGGGTDITNLLPLCSRHHHLAHDGGWTLRLHRDRTLTVIRPGGGETVHGPPSIRAA